MEPVLVQADGHGQSGYLQSLHFWGHYLFDMIQQHLGWGWWTQQVRNPDSWEGYYWGAKHVWGFDATLGEPYQDAVWDDVLEHAEMVIFSGNDPEATGLGMSGSIALEMPKWLKRAGIKIVALSPDLNHAAAVHADTWIPIKPNTDAALYLALAHTWIVEDRYDKEYVASHTVGFDEFKRHVMGEDDGTPKTAAWAAADHRRPGAHHPRTGAGVGEQAHIDLGLFRRPEDPRKPVAPRLPARSLCDGDAGHRPAGTPVPAHRRAVVLQEVAGAGAALSGGRPARPRAQPDDRVRDRQGTEVAGVHPAHPGDRSDHVSVDRVAQHVGGARQDRGSVQELPLSAEPRPSRHPHGVERERQPAGKLGQRLEVAGGAAQSATRFRRRHSSLDRERHAVLRPDPAGADQLRARRSDHGPAQRHPRHVLPGPGDRAGRRLARATTRFTA